MVSKLSKRIQGLELRLQQHQGAAHDISYDAVLELTGFLSELSRKIDHQELGVSTLRG